MTNKFSTNILRTLCIVFLSILSGCALFKSSYNNQQALESTDLISGDQKMPFVLQVNREVNDGKELHILGSVHATTEWNPDRVVLQLTSLNEGNTVGVVRHTLRKLLQDRSGTLAEPVATVASGEEVLFSLAVSSKGISDYQIVLLWGEDAEPYLDSAATTSKVGSKLTSQMNSKDLRLRVHSIEIETLKALCSYPPCDVRFRLKALFQNEGKDVINSAKLGVGFIPSELSGTDTVPESEEIVEVPGLSLQPGVSRPFRILLNKEMPEEVAESVKPVLRIVSFE
jgi:hypothetical protein